MPQAPTPLPNPEPLKKALESLLFITDHPLGVEELGRITGVKDRARVLALVAEIRQELEEKGSPVQLLEVAEGFQMGTRPSYAPFIRKLFSERMTMRLSTAALETLSIIAYKQPLTRAEIEEIRGVEVIAALETLLEKRLIKVVGRKETVGRPLMYGTTMDFLRHFGLKSLEEMPPLDTFLPPEPADPAAVPPPTGPNASPDPRREGNSLSSSGPRPAGLGGARDGVASAPPQAAPAETQTTAETTESA